MDDYGRTVKLSKNFLEAEAAPEMGFSLVGFRFKGIELLDAGTEGAFLKTRKALGPLILPHFNQAGPLPRAGADSFPHAGELKKLGIDHPFQHGVGRYVSWDFSRGENSAEGRLDGGMRRNGFLVSDLAGFDFSAVVTYTIKDAGLEIAFDLRGEAPVAAGIHFYYHLGDKAAAKIRMPSCLRDSPEVLSLGEPVNKVFPVDAARPETAVCLLETGEYALKTEFLVGGKPEESFESLVVFHPENADFVCVEPVSYVVGGENTKKIFRGKILLSPR